MELTRVIRLSDFGVGETGDQSEPEKEFDYRFLFKVVAIPSIIIYMIYSMVVKMLQEPEVVKSKVQKKRK